MRKLACLALLGVVLLLNACSGGSSDAPSDREAHPSGWFTMHAGEALDNPGYTDCVGCHGVDLTGSGEAVSCYSCHSYNMAPPLTFHPAAWSDPYSDHRAFAAANGFASCAGCHGQDLRGREDVPSCYSSSFDGQSCHANGPQEVPHELDGSYRSGGSHGPEAKADLTACQTCHGGLGGPGSNPRFNIGFGENACEDCHGENLAHPADWAGPNNTFHYTADNIQNACTLCHGVNLTGPDEGGIGVSCVGCHDSAIDFTLDCTFCHGYPPDGLADVATDTGVEHPGILLNYHLDCLICHGLNESSTGNIFDPASNYTLFDYSTETNGDHWDGNINMSAEAQYDAANYGCDTTSCHGSDTDHRLDDSGLPVILKTFFSAD